MKSLSDFPISQVNKLAIGINSYNGKADPAPGDDYRLVVEVVDGAVTYANVVGAIPRSK